MALIRHWKLDDNAANTNVVATVGSDGTLLGGDNTADKNTTGPGGTITSAFDLNGTDDGIAADLPSNNSGQAASWSFWFTADALPVALIGISTNSSNNSIRATTDTSITFRPGSTSSTFTVPSLGSGWHHLLITKTTGNSVRLFLDGVESSTGALTNTGQMAPNRIGQTSTVFHDGKIAQVKIFDSDESANVAALYAEGVGSDTTPPTISDWETNVGGDEITGTLSESGCTPASGTGGFTLSGTSATVASWAISGTTITLTLSGTVENGETVLLSYDDSTASEAIEDAAENLLADITDAAVTNNVPDGDELTAGTASFVASGPDGISVEATDATGGTTPYTYQWERNEDGGSFSDLTGETALTCNDDTATTPGVLYGYRLKYTDDATDTVTSNTVTAQVYSGGALTGGSSSVFQSSVIRGA